jgi:hypothetical protein
MKVQGTGAEPAMAHSDEREADVTGGFARGKPSARAPVCPTAAKDSADPAFRDPESAAATVAMAAGGGREDDALRLLASTGC